MKVMWPTPFPAWAKTALKKASSRTRQCALLMLRGYSEQDIADMFDVQYCTVIGYRQEFRRLCREAMGEKTMQELGVEPYCYYRQQKDEALTV
jgi:DNA-directed RNA polymerase specialized sigma24 family protein